ncbi:hypothetical protein E3T46_08650 [Cryobacterium sp. Hh11]|uniref:hypothetical protein n=1 Tax=Cryobacterium sp. Hh11 TaxID=2555868 RepID=UPI00106A24F1|nr:hypothetical protein [Cryobacterium sp. Hh11]TFD51310.1 hypothetical protein E3T46_08650 [Cryobacterium sp. Hh11]
MKVARTRYHFRADADGNLYSVRFPGAKRLLEPESGGPKNYRVLLDSGVVLVASPWLLSPE